MEQYTSRWKTAAILALVCLSSSSCETASAFVHPTARRTTTARRKGSPPLAPVRPNQFIPIRQAPLPTSEEVKTVEEDHFNVDKEVAIVAEEIFDPLHLAHHISDEANGENNTSLLQDSGSLTAQQDQEQINIWAARGLLLLVAALWGTNFASVKYLETLCFHPPCNHPPSEFAFARFAVAGLVSLPLLFKQRLDVIAAGLECGLWITLGYIAQAMALETIPSGKCAFICSLTVVVVPVISALFYGKTITKSNVISGMIALTGVGILEGMVDVNSVLGISPAVADATLETTSTTLATASAASAGGILGFAHSLGIGKGDLLALGQPFGFGLSFLRIEHYVEKFKDVENRVLTIAAAQCVAVGIIGVLWVLYDYNWTFPDFGYMTEPHRIAAIAWTGIMTTVVAIFLEGIALETATATEAALTFSSEPVWASMFGAWLLNEQLSSTSYVGGAFIMTACLLGAVSDLRNGSNEEMDIQSLEGHNGAEE